MPCVSSLTIDGMRCYFHSLGRGASLYSRRSRVHFDADCGRPQPRWRPMRQKSQEKKRKNVRGEGGEGGSRGSKGARREPPFPVGKEKEGWKKGKSAKSNNLFAQSPLQLRQISGRACTSAHHGSQARLAHTLRDAAATGTYVTCWFGNEDECDQLAHWCALRCLQRNRRCQPSRMCHWRLWRIQSGTRGL